MASDLENMMSSTEIVTVVGPNPNRTIKQMDQHTVQMLCTGQIILNVAGACKEIIENALDAKATTIG